jgi:trk system potassium uptake protein TrkA
MYIIICGGGKVGAYLARDLTQKGHAIVIIEKRPERCRKIAEENPRVLVIQGDACNIQTLEEAEAERADAIAVVTGDDDDNLVICQLAREAFKIPRIIGRVNNPKNEPIFHALGIENALSSTTIIAKLIEEEATIGEIFTLHVLEEGNLALVETTVPKNSPIGGKKVAELGLPRDCVLVAVLREKEVIIPRGNTELLPGDKVIALTSIDKEKALQGILTEGTAEACEL